MCFVTECCEKIATKIFQKKILRRLHFSSLKINDNETWKEKKLNSTNLKANG